MTPRSHLSLLYRSGQIERYPLRWWLTLVDRGMIVFSVILLGLAVMGWWRG